MKADQFEKLKRLSAQAPLMPLVGQSPAPQKKVQRPPVARLSVSLPQGEAERIEELARAHALATGDKPTGSELVRAGLMILDSLAPKDRQAALAKVPKLR